MQITNFIKGGNLLTLVVVLLLFCVNPSSAVVYTGLFDGPVGMTNYDGTQLLVAVDGTDTQILSFDTVGTGSASTLLYGLPSNIEDVAVDSNGNIFFVLTNSDVWGYFGSYVNPVDFTNATSENKILLGSNNAYSGIHSIVIDGDDNVFVSSRRDIYLYSSPTYSESLYLGNAATETFQVIQSMGLHPDGLVIGYGAPSVTNGNTRVGLVYGGNLTNVYLDTFQAATATHFFGGVGSTVDGDVYFTHSTGGLSTLYRLNCTNGYTQTTMSSVPTDVTDLIILSDGIVYISFGSSDDVRTYSTFESVGGYTYYFLEGATGLRQLEYDTASVNSMYETYANDSTIEFAYNIDIDVSETSYDDPFGFGQYGGAVALLDDFYWEIDLLAPSGIKIEGVSIANAVTEDYGLFDYHVKATGTKLLQASVWENGTWTLNLYEKDRTTGLRAALDTDTFLIANEITNTTVIDVTPDVDPTLNPIDRINALLASNTFIGVLILLSFIGAFGKIGGVTGLVLGTVAGVSMSALLGYVPMWFVFIMALALAVVFTSKLVGGLGGDK